MKKRIVRIKREFRKMKQHQRPAYMLKHGFAIIKNASTFPGIPYDGATINSNAYDLLEILSAKRKGKKADIAYTDQLDLCIKMIYANYDYVDYVSGGDEKINDLSGMNSRKNTKPRTKRPKTDTAARWIPDMTPNQLTLETTRDEVSRMTTVISSNDEGFKVEMTQGNRIKISLGDKSCLLDFSTAAKIFLKYLEGGKPVEAFIIKANANGLAIPRKMQKITPNIDGNYKPVVPPKPIIPPPDLP
jgi:hypothetical protein